MYDRPYLWDYGSGLWKYVIYYINFWQTAFCEHILCSAGVHIYLLRVVTETYVKWVHFFWLRKVTIEERKVGYVFKNIYLAFWTKRFNFFSRQSFINKRREERILLCPVSSVAAVSRYVLHVIRASRVRLARILVVERGLSYLQAYFERLEINGLIF